MGVFTFASRWKEELVVTGPGGAFVLELTIGVLTAYLPTADAWDALAPPWARPLWPVLRDELEAWCARVGAKLALDGTARVDPL